MPNKERITGRLLNWSLSDQITRVMVSVGVAYGTDVEKAHALMREAAEEHERVLEDLRPVLSFEAFGDHSLTLILRAFINDLYYRLATITDLHKAINRRRNDHERRRQCPQRDPGLAVAGGCASDPSRTTQRWSYAKNAFDKWSALTAVRLVALRGLAPAQ